jgi:hypothetical protein
VRKVSTTGVSWDQRFIMIGTGASDLIPQGYYNIDMPPDGTVIPVHSSALETVTVASGTVPLSNWQALYYEVPLGQNAASQPGNFHIVFWVGGDDYQVPSDWVLVCLRNADTTAHLYKWGDGRAQDAWKALTLQNSWVPYGGGWATPSWRFLDTGEIELHGLVKNGTSPAACTTFASNLAPVGSSTTGFLFSQASNTGGARVDVHGDGQVVVQSYFGGGSNAFVSLDGMRWFPGDV